MNSLLLCAPALVLTLGAQDLPAQLQATLRLPADDVRGLQAELAAAEVPDRFTVTTKGTLKVLAWAEVSHLTTENRLLFVHSRDGRFVLGRTLEELEKQVAPRFFRCHRSAMVALDRVRELVPDPEGTGELRLDTGDRVPVSRDRMAELRRRLG